MRYLTANAVTLALRVVPVLDQARTPKSQMHLHKVIASKAIQITAQKQSLDLNVKLVVNGIRILTYMASGDRVVLGKSLKDSQVKQRVIMIPARNLKRRGK